MKKERYEGIDGLKAYAIIGIVMMHVLSNGKYEIGGFVFEQFIPAFTNLVFLFMMVSAFGMCCGYYQKVIDQKISVEDFYKKRYVKIWPYFVSIFISISDNFLPNCQPINFLFLRRFLYYNIPHYILIIKFS